jgi:hypothetical protein
MVIAAVGIDRKSFWLDEALSLNATASWSEFPDRMRELHGASWLYYVLLFGWRTLAESDSALRLSSALCAGFAVGLTYLVGRRLAGQWGGVLSALLLATNWVFLSHAQELRMYSLAAAMSCMHGLLLLHALRTRSTRAWFACGLLAVPTMAVHYFAFLTWAAQFGAALIVWRRRIPWASAAQAAAVAIAGLIAHALVFEPRAVTTMTYLTTPSIKELVWTIEEFSGATRLAAALLLGSAMIAFLSRLRATDRVSVLDTQIREYFWLGCWLAGPMLALYVLSIVSTPLFLDRYLLPSLPALALLAGCAIARAQPHWLAISLTAAAVLAQVLSYADPKGRVESEDWRSAAAYFRENARPEEPVVFFSYYVEAPFRRYAGMAPTQPTSTPASQPDTDRVYVWRTGEGAVMSFEQAARELRSSARIWLILSHDRLTHNRAHNLSRERLHEMLASLELSTLHEQGFPGVNVRLLARN